VDFKDTLELQLSILDNAAELIASGGKIIYSTCSIEEEENQIQIENFLAKHSDFSLLEQKLLLPDSNNDGAFAAVLVKK
jgi:16S rRNA (cytosine967-C5)-methyltransferase